MPFQFSEFSVCSAGLCNDINKYKKHNSWFEIKDNSYIYINNHNDKIQSSIHLTIKKGIIKQISSIINFSKILEIESMIISENIPSLAEFLIKKSFDFAIYNNISRIFTSIDKHNNWLIDILVTYGFNLSEDKLNENKVILLKDFNMPFSDIRFSYPKININSKAYILSMYQELHEKHFPKTLYENTCDNILQDISPTNTIEKIIITRYEEVTNLKKGDLLLIYKKSDALVPADYGSFIYYVCVVDEVRSNTSFDSLNSYINYFSSYRELTKEDLQMFYYHRNDYFTIKMTFNSCMSKKVTRHNLVKDINLKNDTHWGFFEISPDKLNSILKFGGFNESYISL